jgi:uncharacterized protein YcaQ
MTLRIGNREARRLWLHYQGLSATPTGPLDVLEIIKKLGFVQLDTIRNVTRAHHHIIWSRNQNYREPMLNKLLATDRSIFEHFTHDASVLPMDFYPMWRRQFERLGQKVGAASYYNDGLTDVDLQEILDRIEAEGPLSTVDFDTKHVGEKKMWTRPPHKRALDMMWYAGKLSTSHRKNFRKFYDLTQRVVPEHARTRIMKDEHQLDWLCRAALNRIGFGTIGDIQRFWDAASLKEVRDWYETNKNELISVALQSADGSWYSAFAFPDIKARLEDLDTPTSRLRILNPFDPVIRDRARLERLFGFEYRNEIFVPATKRKWGYYVYPLLEGDRFVGRVELKSDRKKGGIAITQFWPESGTKWTRARQNKFESELGRFGRLIGATKIDWQCPAPYPL